MTKKKSDNLQSGTLIKAFGGFHFVQSQNKTYECSIRGRIQKEVQELLIGDKVQIQVIDDATNNIGVIEKVLPRKNQMLRPKIANVDQVLITMNAVPAKKAKKDLLLLDRLLLQSEFNHIKSIICFNKIDLLPDFTNSNNNNANFTLDTAEIYHNIGYETILASATENFGLAEIRAVLKDKITVLAGVSGVGKTSLLNALGADLPVGKVSEKTKRGRHTTRHTELFNLADNILVADSPGFSLLTLPDDITKENLAELYIDMHPFIGHCRFDSCLHRHEPGCAVKDAVDSSKLDEGRYKRYLIFLDELEKKAAQKYR